MTYFLPDLSAIIINIFSLHSGISPICYYLWLRQMDASLSPGSLPPSPTLPHQVSDQSLVVLKILGGGQRKAGVWMQGRQRPHKPHEHIHKGQRPWRGCLRMQRLPGSFTYGGFRWKTLGFPHLWLLVTSSLNPHTADTHPNTGEKQNHGHAHGKHGHRFCQNIVNAAHGAAVG